MDAAIAGLVGAGIGAFAGIVGTLITNYLQIIQEQKNGFEISVLNVIQIRLDTY